MRKRFVEKLSFYKLLDDLNSLPDMVGSEPIYISKICNVKLEFVDFYFVATKDVDSEVVGFLFMMKPKNSRISSQSLFVHSVDFHYFELKDFIFNSRILTVSDFFDASLMESTDFKSALDKVQRVDNESFTSINP